MKAYIIKELYEGKIIEHGVVLDRKDIDKAMRKISEKNYNDVGYLFWEEINII